MFVEFKNYEDAELALASMQNHPFDAKHTFKVNRFIDIERYAELDETYVEPELEEFTPRVGSLSGSFFAINTIIPGALESMAR